LLADKNFMSAKEINIMGFSNGGLLARYMVEECLNDGQGPKPRNLVSVGAPNMGTEAFVYCETVMLEQLLDFSDINVWAKNFGCKFIYYLDYLFAYLPFAQNLIVTFNDFKMPEKLDEYYKYSSFLPFLNNEVSHPDSERYRANIMRLNTFTAI
jgi:hypothetical protein